ncbi:MAG: HNH endonuclease [Azovibrio sp.]
MNKKPGWQRAFEVVRELGRPVSAQEVDQILKEDDPEYRDDTRSNLYQITVNTHSHGRHGAKPHRSDSGHPHDLLFKVRHSPKNVTFELYDPTRHGIWELYLDYSCGQMRVRQLSKTNITTALSFSKFSIFNTFDPENLEEPLPKINLSAVMKHGQGNFRNKLIQAYGSRCAISGSRALAVLEAAHIIPYRGIHTNDITNGLLLRTDIRKLFDSKLLWVEEGRIMVSPELSATEYAKLSGRQLRQPSRVELQSSKEALNQHAREARARQNAKDVLFLKKPEAYPTMPSRT